MPASDTRVLCWAKDAILNELDDIDVFGPFWIDHHHWIPRGPSMLASAAEMAAQALRNQGLAASTIGIESSVDGTRPSCLAEA